MARTKYTYIILVLFFSYCSAKKTDVGLELNTNIKIDKSELIIIYDKSKKNTEYVNRSTGPKESFYYYRINFDPPYDDPNLHISAFHGLDKGKKIILRKDLDQMTVWFDSEMEYMDWFRLNFEKYYIIYQDEYLVKGSLHPEFEFQAWEVNIATGGIE